VPVKWTWDPIVHNDKSVPFKGRITAIYELWWGRCDGKWGRNGCTIEVLRVACQRRRFPPPKGLFGTQKIFHVSAFFCEIKLIPTKFLRDSCEIPAFQIGHKKSSFGLLVLGSHCENISVCGRSESWSVQHKWWICTTTPQRYSNINLCYCRLEKNVTSSLSNTSFYVFQLAVLL
jgi:hypothetical protein